MQFARFAQILSVPKVDMRKVNLQVIRPWITNKVIELVGFEDEVVIEYAMGLLEDESKPVSVAFILRKLYFELTPPP